MPARLRIKGSLPLLAVAVALAAVLAGCGEPAFRSGIRDQSFESFSGASPGVPLPGVLDYGSAASGGVNNGATSFSGVTSGLYAIDDRTNAAVGTTWFITFNLANAMPACPPADKEVSVPSQGLLVKGVCFAF